MGISDLYYDQIFMSIQLDDPFPTNPHRFVDWAAMRGESEHAQIGFAVFVNCVRKAARFNVNSNWQWLNAL